jgi:hypothetical protein
MEVIAENRKARFECFILEEFEAVDIAVLPFIININDVSCVRRHDV